MNSDPSSPHGNMSRLPTPVATKNLYHTDAVMLALSQPSRVVELDEEDLRTQRRVLTAALQDFVDHLGVLKSWRSSCIGPKQTGRKCRHGLLWFHCQEIGVVQN